MINTEDLWIFIQNFGLIKLYKLRLKILVHLSQQKMILFLADSVSTMVKQMRKYTQIQIQWVKKNSVD